MASVLKVDTLTGVTTAGSIAVTGEGNSTTTNLQQGLCKAYGMIDGTGTANLITSFNGSGVTDNGTGDYTFNLTNSMSNSTYMFMIDSHNNATGHSERGATKYDGGQTAGSFRFTVGYASNTSGGGTKYDEDFNPITLMGDLA